MKKTLFVYFATILSFSYAIAQWEPAVRITSNDSTSSTSEPNTHCIASDTLGNVHLVWYDKRDGKYEIYYRRSTDFGTNWLPEIRLSNDTINSITPSIAILDSFVHVLWADSGIHYKRSSNYGETWILDTLLSNNGNCAPCIAASPNGVHTLWYKDGLACYLFYKRSLDNGTTWFTDTNITYGNWPTNSSIAASDTIVYAAFYTNNMVGTTSIEFYRSTNSGSNWSSFPVLDAKYEGDVDGLWGVSLAATDSFVHATWIRCNGWEPPGTIRYDRSTSSGSTWTLDTTFYTNSNYPNIFSIRSNVHTVWQRGTYIKYCNSFDAGINWSNYANITISSDSLFPSVCAGGPYVHVVWRDKRDGNWEIYYKRNPTGNLGVSELPGNTILPDKVIMKATPNPFNRFTSIIGHEKELFFLYDISGRLIGTYKGIAIGTDLLPGIYLLRPKNNILPILKIVKIR